MNQTIEQNEIEVKQSSNAILASAKDLVVKDKESVEMAQDIIIDLDKQKKRIEAYWKDPKAKASEAHKAIVAKEKEMLEPLAAIRDTLTKSVNKFLNEERRRLEDEQRKADEERRRKEAEEKARLEKEAESALDAGDTESAEILLQASEEVELPPEIVAPQIEKSFKTSSGTMSQIVRLKADVTDLKAFCKEVAEGRAPVSLIQVRQSDLEKWVKLQGHKQFPGLRIWEDVGTSFRGK